jgi:hydroxyacylglutathione hydrolase
MEIERLVLGTYETNCYVLRNSPIERDCLIIDTGLDAAGLVDFLNKGKFTPKAIVLTHGHVDHISGVTLLRKEFSGIRVYIHKLDANMLSQGEQNLSMLAGRPFSAKPADFLLEEGDTVREAGISLEVFHTPGHTPGGISLYAKDDGIVFVGDALFAGSVGRTDFPGGDMAQLIASIKEKLLSLPDETIVYPGHGPATTIARERSHNPFLQ